jgi:hypothetical protein
METPKTSTSRGIVVIVALLAATAIVTIGLGIPTLKPVYAQIVDEELQEAEGIVDEAFQAIEGIPGGEIPDLDVIEEIPEDVIDVIDVIDI